MDAGKAYEHVAAIYEFAAAMGYTIKTFKTSERRSKKGAYNFVELTLVAPEEAQNILEASMEILEAQLKIDDGAEALEK